MDAIHDRSLAAVALACATACGAAPPAYVVHDLGTLSGANEVFEPGTVGLGISAGAIVGYSVTTLEHRNFHGFRVAPGGEMQDLGVLKGDDHSIAFASNGAGDAVGVSYSLGLLTQHGVLWTAAGETVELGSVVPHDINDAGAIAASAKVVGAPGTTHATLLVGATSTDLGTLGGPTSTATALNADNWVVGQSMLSDGLRTRAFAYRNGAMLDLGTLGGLNSAALDVRGLTVVGVADTSANVPHAARWLMTPAGAVSAVSDLGLLPGMPNSGAYGVNASGSIVGISGDRAFLWSAGAMIDLNSQIGPTGEWHLTRATGIDDSGRIVGTGKHFGLQRAFLLVPREPADLDADGDVDAGDLAILLGGWGGGDFDLDGDGTVGAADLAILLGAWG